MFFEALLHHSGAIANSLASKISSQSCERRLMNRIGNLDMSLEGRGIDRRFQLPAFHRTGLKYCRRLPKAISWRGGALPDLQAFFSANTTRCWFVLILAILTDTFAAALMKSALDEGSTPKLAISYFAYFVRSVKNCLVLFFHSTS